MKTSTIDTDETSIYPMPRKANECIIDLKQFFLPPMLFDEFWREGELALLYGAPGTGKSVLAVQIAEALARGCGLDGFRISTGRRKVLYVDLVLRDEQFQARHTDFSVDRRYPVTYKFSENLYRDRPVSPDKLDEWLRGMITANEFRVVIIDDLSAIRRTHDGTRDTLQLMRRLRELRDEFRVSILVLTDSAETRVGRFVSEADLGRSRVLCSVADSVFATGRHPSNPDTCLIQTRSRNTRIFWDHENAPICRVTRLESGMLGLQFDERFSPRMDPEALRLICRVKSMRDAGVTYRGIALKLGISKTQAARLFKKWTPALGSEPGAVATGFMDDCGLRESEAVAGGFQIGMSDESIFTTPSAEAAATPPIQGGEFDTDHPKGDEIDEWDEAEFEKPVWLDEFAGHERDQILPTANGQPPTDLPTAFRQPPSSPHGPHPCPFLYDGSPDAERWFQHLVRTHPERTDESVLRDYVAAEPWCRPPGAAPPHNPNDPFSQMEATIDDHGNEIFVEERDERNKPRVWYLYRSDGCLIRYVSDGNGRSGTPANPNLFGRFAKRKPRNSTNRSRRSSSFATALGF